MFPFFSSAEKAIEMKDPVQQQDAFERVALLMGLPTDALSRNSQGEYTNPQTLAGWKAWQVETSGLARMSAADRDERIMSVYREHGSCRENDEADHLSFARDVLDSFMEPSNEGQQ